MKCVILAGGKGTRINDGVSKIPKPLVEVGGKPILWHVMKIYAHYGIDSFVICSGYKGHYIKEYFANYRLHNSDIEVRLGTGNLHYLNEPEDDWLVKVIDTGENTLTAGRLLRIKQYVDKSPFFLMTYGDGVSDVDIKKLVQFHLEHKKIATVTAVQPAGRFGSLRVSKKGCVEEFSEKTDGSTSLINAGFFVLSPRVFDYIPEDVMFEGYPLENIAKDGQLMAYRHEGFFKPMDTQKDRIELDEMWNHKAARWKVW